MIIGSDLEWTKGKIDVLGLGWDEGKRSSATDRNEQSLGQYLQILKKADRVVGQNYITDCRWAM